MDNKQIKDIEKQLSAAKILLLEFLNENDMMLEHNKISEAVGILYDLQLNLLDHIGEEA